MAGEVKNVWVSYKAADSGERDGLISDHQTLLKSQNHVEEDWRLLDAAKKA